MSLSISVNVPQKSLMARILDKFRRHVEDKTDETLGQLAYQWQRETAIGWPVDTGFSRASIETPTRVAPGRWTFRVTADYARVIEYGGYRGVGPKTQRLGPEQLDGGIEINEGIYAIQRPSAPLRRAMNTVRRELPAAMNPALGGK